VAGLAKAFGSGAMTNSIEELEEADCIFIIGSNTTEQHPLIASRIFKAKQRGAKIILADPRNIQLAAIADIHLRHKAGTDVPLINGLMNVILAEKLEDKEFIAARTEGFDALREILKKFPPDKVSEITGVPKEDLVAAAKTYAQATAGSIVYCMGITQHRAGTDCVLSLANLAMLTGNMGKPSTGVNPLRGQNNVQGACDMGGLPNVFTGYQAVNNDAAREKFEKAWQSKLSPTPGLTVVEMLSAAVAGKVKAMYVMGENPMLSDPDTNHVREALEKLDFLVVQDIFLNETARLADVVLPAVSFAEKDGTFTNTDRRVQKIRKAIEPLGQARPDWQIICDIAKRMGRKDFSYNSPSEIFDEMTSLTPQYAGITHERLEKGPLAWPCPKADHPGTQYLHKDKFSRGLGLFTAIDYIEAAELPSDDYPLTLTTGRIMFHYHTGTMTRNSPSLEREVNEPFMEINAADAASLGVKNQEKVRVHSRRGQIELKALVTDRVDKGTVFIPFHFWEAPANMLTNPALDPVSKIPEYKVCAVHVEKM
jgi:formate dehydrogenase alpha subunit